MEVALSVQAVAECELLLTLARRRKLCLNMIALAVTGYWWEISKLV